VRGLVLTAGGARGAYQAGVLKRVGELRALRGRPCPFEILAGASAGAINGAVVASGSDDFRGATRRLAAIWSDLRAEQVFRADPLSLGWNGARLLRDLSLGGLLGAAGHHSLLDASPLRAFLARHARMDRVGPAIERGVLYAVAISATSYHSGRSFTFVQGRAGHPLWRKSRRVALPVELTLDHVLASAAIPLVFQPVRVATEAGALWFGDGALRLVSPFSPAIRLGATRVLGIGVRCTAAAADLSRAELVAQEGGESDAPLPQPPMSQICGVFLNAIFLDHLDADLDHLVRMNELVESHRSAAGADELGARDAVGEPMRVVRPLVVNPSEDLALVASRFSGRLPRLIRYVMDGLGAPDVQSADLTSYLLFDSAYTRTLVEIGYRDADKRIDEIEEFLELEGPPRRD
jgi:NTE family protein